MALIPRADFERRAADAVPVSIGDVRRQAEALVQAAEREAARILDEARAERERLLADAHEQGRAAGFAEGREAGQAEGVERGKARAYEEFGPRLETLQNGWELLLNQFDSARDRLLAEARDDALRLALRFAEAVTNRVVEVDESVALAQLERALSRLAEPTRVRIAHHPDDAEVLGEGLGRIVAACDRCTHAELVADPSVSRGSVVLRSEGGGEVEADVVKEIARLAVVLLPKKPDEERSEAAA